MINQNETKQEENKMVTISSVLYDELINDQQILHALYAGGVDNWEGYEQCMDMDMDMDIVSI